MWIHLSIHFKVKNHILLAGQGRRWSRINCFPSLWNAFLNPKPLIRTTDGAMRQIQCSNYSCSVIICTFHNEGAQQTRTAGAILETLCATTTIQFCLLSFCFSFLFSFSPLFWSIKELARLSQVVSQVVSSLCYRNLATWQVSGQCHPQL